MKDQEQLAVLRALASAEALAPHGAEQLLSVLQIELPETDWFALVAEHAPWFRLSCRGDEGDEPEELPDGSY